MTNRFFADSVDSDRNINNSAFEELNEPITAQVIQMAIKKLKSNKAPGPYDNLLNDYFIYSADILIGHLTNIFNKVFNAKVLLCQYIKREKKQM